MKITVSSTAKKIAATIGVAAIFVFFWINGPIQELAASNFESIIETEYAKVSIVGEEATHQTHGTIEQDETHGYGWQLMTNKTSEERKSGLLSSKKQLHQTNKQLTQQLTQHITQHYNGKNLHPITAHDVTAIVFENTDGKHLYTETQHILPHVLGYGGPINLGVLLNYEGQIEQVTHISSKETQSYLRTIAEKGYYSQFPRLKMNQQNQIDAVSGATISTKAMAQIINESIPHLTPILTENTITSDDLVFFGVIAQNTWYWVLHAMIIAVMFLYGFQKKYKKTKKHVTVLSIFSLVYIGFFLNSSFTYTTLLHPFLGTSISLFMGVYSLLTLLGAIWGKNIYCKYVCPFGHAQRLSLKASNNRFTSTFPIPNKWVEHIRNGLAVTLITGVILGLRSWANFELFPDLFGMEYTTTWALVSISIILINLRYPFIWCRIACPTGAVLDGLSKGCK